MEGGKKIYIFLESRRFLPIMLGEGGSYFGKDDYSSLCVTVFPIKSLLRELSYSVRGDGISSWENPHL